MLSNIIKTASNATNLIAQGVVKELLGEPKVDAQKYKCKEKIKELEKLIVEKKDKVHKDFYFKTKSKINTFHSELTRFRDLDKLKRLEQEIKDQIIQVKNKK